jgi:epoxyqueuosine reductase
MMIDKNQNRENYQKLLDKEIEKITAEGRTPTLLIHSCCAPCSSYVLEYLSRYFEITDFYYNPNIQPEEEYEKRARELEHLIERLPVKNKIKFMEGRYYPDKYLEAVKGLENEPEGGKRCTECFKLRLFEAARVCQELGLEYFTTTLTISPMKDPVRLNDIGRQAAAEYGVKFLPSEFRKKGGYLRSIELSKEYDLYRQDYCGCVFSKAERERQKTGEKE